MSLFTYWTNASFHTAKVGFECLKADESVEFKSSWIGDNAVPASDLGQITLLSYWMNILLLSSHCLYLVNLLPSFVQTDVSASVSYHPCHESGFHMIQDGLNICIPLLIKVGYAGRKKNAIPVIVSR